jgi:sarcosine oxidase subunit alpha
VIDTTDTISFAFDRRSYTGYAGDTIGSALFRAGVRVFSRSFKYHRPRGLSCVSGACPNCLVNVDGTPNVRSCVTPLQAGMVVQSQNAWPSLERDVMSVVDRLDRFLPVGFYYKTFMRPRALWPAYETALRHAAGLGRIDPDPDRFVEPYYDKSFLHSDVAVIGAGPAGMSAALAAAQAGVRVLLVDENPRPGGHLLYLAADPDSPGSAAASEASRLSDEVTKQPNIDLLTRATAFGWYEGNLIGIVHGNRLIKLRTSELIVATGQMEQPLIFAGNDLPGVMLGTGVLRLLHLYQIRPAQRALVVTNNDAGWIVARDLKHSGVDVAMVLDARPHIPESELVSRVQAAGAVGLPAYTILAAQGDATVTGAVAVRLDQDGKPVPGTEVELQCDLISVSTGSAPNNALLYQSGSKLVYDPDLTRVVPVSYAPGVRAAGHVAAPRGLAGIILDGRVAGLEAAMALNRGTDGPLSDRLSAARQELEALQPYTPEKAPTPLLMKATKRAGKRFVCFCEDVTEKDVLKSIAEGFDDIETLKRYSTVSMGPCQGKMCARNTVHLCAQATGRTVTATGSTTSRPPVVPIKLGVLAGRKLEPIRHTPMHQCHLTLGARMMDAGQWKRPEHYGDPNKEALAVRQDVGVIDVSTLGKVDVHGPDAAEFLNRIYTARVADMAVGQIRYGLMCTEEGIIFDDGVVCRLAQDSFFLTTSTGGAQTVFEWLTWWQAAWDLQVHISDVSATYAAMNVAGPQARQMLSPIVDRDLSPQAFHYLQLREAELSGVPVRLLRLGFVGELGFEIHCPADRGAAVWDALMEAGSEFGITPFGIEAQRILRLEKGHIIVGQDTDALSDPFGASIGWAVDLNKPDFLGKSSLLWRAERRQEEKLVGFRMRDPMVLPSEGEQFIDDGKPIGRVTSARFSPTLGQSIGLGWVPVQCAQQGTEILVRTAGTPAEAVIVPTPFYDREGARVRM